MDKVWSVIGISPGGTPNTWSKDYLRRGRGYVDLLRSGRFYWEAWIASGRDDSIPLGGGYVDTLREAQDIVDDYFELVDEY